MSTPTSHARWLRGGLVGACSAILTATAHTFAQGELPRGSALIVAMLLCATAGTAVARLTLDGRHARLVGAIGALSIAQVLGHLSFVVSGGHHHSAAALGFTPAMVAAHLGAALVLGAAIAAVEYLYVVSVSVLRWLRIFAALALRPRVRRVPRVAKTVVAESVLFNYGLGMRAPPARYATAA
ncbi:hypothetical protein [Mycolicibacterium celeriflavum]|uniref:Uncharacterized protein n=1 Tax=Mycolicibacterium celeriflavum TaxID=1249101 RepID=A0A1X0BMC2_MYCCF|nr:hypothetical protein [Mycolicibacterium celeriflavum]MCV7240981.1 hypothetical protein [Mycolicibacterium celeriflavum]ORA43507.1 hypothetical protein BST21_21580 [Mycolicibacterium celeriflavum]BBY45601.1 hypothetical protein MCEL_38960 [Mycolicibacterium celeriflavum]